MKKIIFLIAIISSLFAKSEHADFAKYLKNHIPKDLTCLELNTKQHKTVNKILISHRKKLIEFNQYKKEKESFLKSYIKTKNFDKKLYYDIKDEINKKALRIESDYLENIFDILDDTQRRVFSSFIQEWRVE